MRLLGLVLVAIGALVLGVNGFGAVLGGRAEAGGDGSRAGAVSINAPVVGGIAVVSGLLLLAGGGRRD